jgi:dolichyl-phosphate-mannose--protein O-mannosyl transferase
MPLETPPHQPVSWFRLGLLGLLVFSLALRFWGVDRFNTLVFDEVYYVKFANHYLDWIPFFDGHPPLSKYLIALGIWIGNQLPIGQETINALAGSPYTTWSYRWLNALTGSFIPLVVAGIAYQLTRRSSYALIAGLFAALDGLFLVESRYALNNVYLVLFGLVGHWCLLLALNCALPVRREGWLTLAGISFGASAAVKWNGLWFLFGAYGLWISAGILQRLRPRTDPANGLGIAPATRTASPLQRLFSKLAIRSRTKPFQPPVVRDISPLQRLTQLKLWQVGLHLVLIPAIAYCLVWIPHLQLNAKAGFWQDFWDLQQQILRYHKRVGSGPNIHPYCSTWYSWLVMQRPVAYFYQIRGRGDPLPAGSSTAPVTGEQVIYDVHAMGNPILWWLSTVAILLLLLLLLYYGVNWLLAKRPTSEPTFSYRLSNLALSPTELWLAVFLLVNYGANLLPWTRVSRCIFLYHYMGASVFSAMAVAWLCDRWLHSPQPRLRMMGIAIILAIGLAFLFWLPIYLGLPLSPVEFRLRMWLPSWV